MHANAPPDLHIVASNYKVGLTQDDACDVVPSPAQLIRMPHRKPIVPESRPSL